MPTASKCCAGPKGSDVAASVLTNLDVDLRKARMEVENMVQAGPDMISPGRLPLTPPAMKALDQTIDVVKNLKH